jgi:hypothetical protein
MGNSSSKNKHKKQHARSIAATPTHSKQHQHEQQQQQQQQQPQQQYVPDYRQLEPEQLYDDDDLDFPNNVPNHPDASADIDSCIQRLLAVGKTKHIGRSLCLTEPEVIAICRYAYNIFLDQPVSCVANGMIH